MKPIGRRTFLRGAGTALALPLLDAMLPFARAGEAGPMRLAFLSVPNGVYMPEWTPAAEGGAFALPPLLEPLAPVREEILLLSGLCHNNARALGDGPGDHARAGACFLTGAHPVKTDGAGIRAGVSVDQVAAAHLGARTRLASLELGCEPALQAGNCDSGYSCAYSSNISWRSPTSPVAKEVNPRLVFERLFDVGGGESAAARARRLHERRSILDYVRDDARALQARVGRRDREKLGEYLDGVREIERRIARAEEAGAALAAPEGEAPPAGVPEDYREHVSLMGDLLVLAFRLDLTRVSTFMLANEGSNRNYEFIGASGGHHTLSHHGGDAEKIECIRRINRFHVEQFARVVARMRETPEGEGCLLDRTVLVYGSAIGDGDRHNHDDLPVLLAGRGNGALTPGRHVRFPAETPLCNLFLSLLDHAGVPVATFGDSTGRLAGL